MFSCSVLFALVFPEYLSVASVSLGLPRRFVHCCLVTTRACFAYEPTHTHTHTHTNTQNTHVHTRTPTHTHTHTHTHAHTSCSVVSDASLAILEPEAAATRMKCFFMRKSCLQLASSPGRSQILSRSCGSLLPSSGSGLGTNLPRRLRDKNLGVAWGRG